MTSLSQLKESEREIVKLKALRVADGLKELNISDEDAEKAVSSPTILRQLRNRSDGGERSEVLDNTVHDLLALMHLVGEGPPASLLKHFDDVLTSDLDPDIIRGEVCPELGIENLQITENKRIMEVEGSMYGTFERPFVALPVHRAGKPIHLVPFLIDSGSPITLISVEALETLLYANSIPDTCMLMVNGYRLQVRVAAEERLKGINILGADFFMKSGAEVVLRYPIGQVKMKMYFED